MDSKDLIITITAEDLAGNQILKITNEDTIDPSTQLTRDTTGNMQGEGGEDTRHRVNVDTTPPEINITGVKRIKIDDEAQTYEGIYATTPLTGSYTVTDNVGIDKVKASSSGLSSSKNQSVSDEKSDTFTFDKEGCNYIKVTAEDLAGNTATSDVNFLLDNTPPTISGLPLDRSCVRTKRPTITAIADDKLSGVKILSVSLDGEKVEVTANAKAEDTCPLSNTLQASCTPSSDLFEGEHTVVATATDRAGNISSEVRKFTINLPPEIEITGVIDGELKCSVPVDVEYNVTDTDLVGNIAVSSSGVITKLTPTSGKITFDKDGNQYIEITATDTCGSTTKKVDFKIDLKFPQTTLSGPSGVILLRCLGRCGPPEECRNVSYTISGDDNNTPPEKICFETNLPVPSKYGSPQVASWCIKPGIYRWEALAVDECGHKKTSLFFPFPPLPEVKNLIVVPPPSCDCPDEAETVATFSPNPQPTAGEPIIAVLERGLGEYVENLFSIYKEPIAKVFEDSPLSEYKKYKALIIPAGGLIGLERSEIIKTVLDNYVKDGGIIVAFTQQYGYEFSLLPGGKVSGYGWREDQSCQANAASIDEYHQILSSQKYLQFDGGIDGFFTQWPENAKVLLRRTKNNMPAMILYPYGKGYVIATTLYTDFSYAQGSITQDELDLIKDIINWAKNPKEYVETKPNATITIPITIVNNTDKEVNKVRFRIQDTGYTIIKEEIIDLLVPAGQTITYNYTFIAPANLGIYSIYYELLTMNDERITLNFADNFSVSQHLTSITEKPELSSFMQKQKILTKDLKMGKIRKAEIRE